MNEALNIPKHWQVKKLSEVCEVITGTTPSKNNKDYYGNDFPFFKPTDLNQGISTSQSNDGLTIEGISKARLLPENSILVTCIGATIGKTGLIKRSGACNQQINAILPNDLFFPKFLYYQIIQREFQNKIVSNAASTTLPILNKTKFVKLGVIIPPLPEQQAIVAKIEELLSDLDNGVQQLQTAQQQLKVYRQSLLKAAFEGKLTHKEVKDGELPEGWKWLTFGEVCTKIGDIDHKMPKQLLSGYPYVSTKDFTDELKISFENVKYISKEDYLNLSRKIRPERGDIIFPRYGTIGKNILIDFDKEFLVSYSCAVIKPNPKLVLSKYIYLFSLSPKISEEIRKYTVETTQANVGIVSIKSFVFPLPSIEDQQKVVSELESKLTVCDKIEETIQQSLQQAESLQQSILKKAFEGRLVAVSKDYREHMGEFTMAAEQQINYTTKL